jgi:N-sulphoglucosamine sulphohydrolase, C-terminal
VGYVGSKGTNLPAQKDVNQPIPGVGTAQARRPISQYAAINYLYSGSSSNFHSLSVLRVPLILRAPAVAARRIRSVVRLVDVLPTVLQLLDMPRPHGDGMSLLDMMAGRAPPLDLEAYSESLYPRRFGWSPLRALNDGRFKFIEAPRREQYDLEIDPFETRNVYDERRLLADAIARRLNALDGTNALDITTAHEPPEPLRQRLAALGYVGAMERRPSGPLEPLVDPKDCIGLVSALSDRDNPGWRPSPRCR